MRRARKAAAEPHLLRALERYREVKPANVIRVDFKRGRRAS